MRFKILNLTILSLSIFSIAYAGINPTKEDMQKHIDAQVEKYVSLQTPNSDRYFDIFISIPLYETPSFGYTFRKESEVVEFVFACLEKFSQNPQRASLNYLFKFNQLLNMLYEGIDFSHFRHASISEKLIDDRHAEILFNALKAQMFPMRGSDKNLAQFMENLTQINMDYSALAGNFESESSRIELIEKWRKAYFEREAPPHVLASDKKELEFYNMFLKDLPHLRIEEYKSSVMDGGSKVITMYKGARMYQIFVLCNRHCDAAGYPRGSLKIYSNYDGYYAVHSIILSKEGSLFKMDFEDSHKIFKAPHLKIEKFYEAIKSEPLRKSLIGIFKEYAKSSLDEGVRVSVKNLLEILEAESSD